MPAGAWRWATRQTAANPRPSLPAGPRPRIARCAETVGGAPDRTPRRVGGGGVIGPGSGKPPEIVPITRAGTTALALALRLLLPGPAARSVPATLGKGETHA